MARTIAFSSGKGGVGKTSVSVNCAIQLVKMGYRVALLDADFGMANSHILLDQKINQSLWEVINGDVKIKDIILNTNSGVQLIPGGSGVIEMLNLDSRKRWEIIKSVKNLEETLDFLILDTPAGGSDATIDFAAACQNVVVVLVGEPTSFMDAYALVKALYLERQCNKFSILVNLSNSAAEAQQNFKKFKEITTKFLDVELDFAGWLPVAQEIRQSVISRKPVALQENLKNRTLSKNLLSISKFISVLEPCPTNGISFFS